jgi:hypothetical protein
VTLLDDTLPVYDVAARYRTEVRASPAAVYHALWHADIGASRLIRFLLRLRWTPGWLAGQHRAARSTRRFRTLGDVVGRGFGVVAERPGDEVVLGTVGRFWRIVGEARAATPADFSAPLATGLARAAWSFRAVDAGRGRTELSTETRVQCADPGTRWRFRVYWALIAPASGWIRREVLRVVRQTAERSLLSTVAPR